MTKFNDHRLENLRRLISDRGGPAELARQLGYSNASFIVQMAGPNPMRAVTEKTARGFEKKLKLPVGYLDTPVGAQAAPAAPLDMPLTVEIIKLVGQVLQDEGVTLAPARFSDLVVFALTESAEQKKLATADQIKRAVRLMAQ